MAKQKVSILKQVAGKVHLWLGLALGIIVLVSYLAAAIYAWEPQLRPLINHHYHYADVADAKISLDKQYQAAQHLLGDTYRLEGVALYPEANARPVWDYYKGQEDSLGGIWAWDDDIRYDYVFTSLSPTGQVETLHKDMRFDGFKLLERCHVSLLLRYQYGHWLTAGATIVSLILVLTGFVLWWPKQRKHLKQKLTVKWSAAWRRVNYDIHSATAVYAAPFILILAFTGLYWSFDWWAETLYKPFEGAELPSRSLDKLGYRPFDSIQIAPAIPRAYEATLKQLDKQGLSYERIYFGLPTPDEDHEAVPALDVNVLVMSGRGFSRYQEYRYAIESNVLELKLDTQEASFAAQILEANYDIHVGALFGWPHQLIMSLAALLLACLPISGFLIWYGRKFKVKKQAKP